MSLSLAVKDWQALIGEANVVLGDALADYANDTTGAQRHIPAALRIQDSACLTDVMRIASSYKVPVYPISTGKNWGYGTALPARHGCVIIDLSALQRIIHFDAELGVITLEPGVTQGMLADFLEAGNHPYLVPVTGAGPKGGLLGNALERGYGVTPHVDHFGAVTDLEAVLADGSLYRTALREAGGEELARMVVAAAEVSTARPQFLYPLELPIKQKIHTLATEIYGAADVSYSAAAEQQIASFEANGFGNLPICMAKTHLSLSHDPELKGAPQGFIFPIREVRASVGAGFIFPLAGSMPTMPGLGAHPAAHTIDIDDEGRTVGLF